MRKLNFICETCKEEFITKKAYKNRIPKFCSMKCYGISNRKDRKCPMCGEHVSWDNKTFCSKECRTKDQKGKKLSEEHKKSLSLAKIGKRPLHFIEQAEEIRKKLSKALMGKPQPWMRGKKHPNYVDGGKEKWERQKAMGRVEYKIWRRAVFARDDYTCVICHKKGVRLNADHIQPWALFPELRYELSNGRTLCVCCHRKTSTWGSVRRKKQIPVG